jgi:hypothetical protein
MSEGIQIDTKKWEKFLQNIDLKDRKLKSRVVAIMKHPFKSIYKSSQQNLTSQGSVKTGGLIKSFSVRQKSRRGRLSVAFGGKKIQRKGKFSFKAKRMKGVKATGKARARQIRGGSYFYPVNAGTIQRRTKKGYNRGKLGDGSTGWQKGFADRAILKALPLFPADLAKGFQKLMDEQTDKANKGQS